MSHITWQDLLRTYLVEQGYKVTKTFEVHPEIELIVMTLGDRFWDEDAMTNKTIFFQTIGPEIITLTRNDLGWRTIGYLYEPDCFQRVERFIEEFSTGSETTFEFFG